MRLYRATRFTLDEVKVKGLPESLDEALKWDDPQDQLQMHSAGGGPAGGRGRRPMLFHGHAVGTDDERSNTERFLRAVHDALRGTLIDEGGPLVLAGVDYLTHAYRDANSYPGLASHSVSGNPDEADVHELHAKAWKVVEPELSRPRAEAATRVEELRGNGGRSTVDLTDVVAAAHRGQVDVLFVATDLEVWGVWNASEGTVQVSEARDAGDVDLLELAATAVLERRGTVYAVKTAEIPGGGPVAALLRY